MDYSFVKAIHILAVTLSGLGFALRFAGAAVNAGWVRSRPVRTLPHFIDTVLLLSAISLALIIRANPLEQFWLLAKITALLVYIVLGMLALNLSRPLAVRIPAGIAALTVFAYIVSVAISKQPAGFLAALAA